MANWMIVCLALVLALDLFATFVIARALSLGPSQRLIQVPLIWLLPVVGATVVLAFMAADRHTRAEALSLESPIHPGDETALAQGPGPCGCSTDGGGGDD